MNNDNIIPLQTREQYRDELRDNIWGAIAMAMERELSAEEIAGALSFVLAQFQHDILFGAEDAE